MLLVELYAIRAKVAEAATENDEAAEAKQKIIRSSDQKRQDKR